MRETEQDRQSAVADDDVVVRVTDRTVREAIHDLRWRLDTMLAGGPATLKVDVRGLTRLSSPTIAALLWAKRRCATRGVPLVLVGHDRALIHRAGLDGLFVLPPPDEPPDSSRKA